MVFAGGKPVWSELRYCYDKSNTCFIFNIKFGTKCRICGRTRLLYSTVVSSPHITDLQPCFMGALILLEKIFLRNSKKIYICTPIYGAQLAELVDALDSNSSTARCAGSIPALGTKPQLLQKLGFFVSCILYSCISLQTLNNIPLFFKICHQNI